MVRGFRSTHGWVLYNVFNTRLWDYNTEIWNFGNVGGYVCFRSVFVFGLAGLMLIYAVIPMLVRLMKLFDPSLVNIVCLILGAVFLLDCMLYRINHRLKK